MQVCFKSHYFHIGDDFIQRVLIFGVGGFVGPYLAQELLDHGYHVIGSDICIGRLPKGIAFHNVDIMDSKQVASVIKQERPNCIINLAALSSVGLSWKKPQETISINVLGSLNILEEARKYAIEFETKSPDVMLIGSSEEYATTGESISEQSPLDASNPYGLSKITLEQFALLYRSSYNMNIFCVRPFNHTGIGQRDTFVLPSFCKQVADIDRSESPGIIRVGNLTVQRDFSHVKDVVSAYRLILEKSDSTCIYNIGSGKAYSLNEILSYIVSLSSQNITIYTDPELLRPVDVPIIYCDNSKIIRDLNWQPHFTVFDAVREMYYHYKNGI